MPTYRIGIGSEFNLKDRKVGIGSESPIGDLDVSGIIKSGNLYSSGISTLTTYSGFSGLNKDRDSITFDRNCSTESDIVVGVGETFIVSAGATVNVGSISDVKIGNTFGLPVGGVEDRSEAPVEGTVRFNKDFNTLEFYNGVEWRQFTVSGASGRGLVIGGYTPSPSIVYKEVQTFNFSTKGNTTHFGQSAMSAPYETAGFGSKIRAFNATDGSYTKQIDYYILASQSNGIDFGELTVTGGYGSALSSQTRGVISAGFVHPSPSANSNIIDYIEMATTGDAVDFGDHTNVGNIRAALSDGVRGVWAGNGGSPSPSAEVQLNIIASKGDSVTYGDLSYVGGNKGASNSTRGIINNINGNEAYQLDSGGHSILFGDLTASAHQSNVSASQTRVVIAGGRTPSFTNTISYVTIATLGNAEDFGDLSGDNASGAACSDSHGGLGGY